MVSLQSHVVIAKYWITRRKRVFADPVALRRSVETGHEPENGAPPAFVRQRCDLNTSLLHGFPCYTLAPRRVRPRRHVLYLHGGAYVHQVERAHWRFLTTLVDEAGCSVSVPIYPLAPAHRYDETLPMVIEASTSLFASVLPEDQVIMGDSAGGGMSLYLAQHRHRHGLPQPGRVILISPWLDTAVTDPLSARLDERDPFLSPAGLREAARLYAGDLDPHDPRISPIYGDLTGLAPLSVFVGTRDVLLADARRLLALTRQQGIPLDYVEYDGMFHGWVLQSIPEAAAATREIAERISSPV